MEKSTRLILVAALCAVLTAEASADSIRSFDAQIVEAEFAGDRLIVSTFPDSGKRWEVELTPETRLTMDRELPRGTLQLGKPAWVRAQIIEKGHRKGVLQANARSLAVDEILLPPAARASRTPRGMLQARFEKRGDKVIAIVDGDGLAYLRGSLHDYRYPIVWSLDETMQRDAIEPGLTGKISMIEAGEGWVAKTVHLKIQHKPYGTYIAHAAVEPAEPLERMWANVKTIKAQHAGIAAELDQLAPVDLRVEPALLKPDETPRLTIRAISDKQPNRTIVIQPDRFRDGRAEPFELRLDWKRAKDDRGRTMHTTELELPADRLGQYLVHWACDIGGDIDDYWRNYAVVDKDSTVVLLNNCGVGDGSDRAMLLEHKLPHTYWMGESISFSNMLRQESADWWAEQSRAAREFGLEPQLFFFRSYWADDSMAPLNFDGDREQYIREVLRAYKELWPLYRYPLDCLNAGTYAYSTAFTRALMKEGFESKVSVCPTHTLEHGPGQMINTSPIGHYPHYISREDFRKTGNETGRNPVSISQWTGNFLRGIQGAGCFDSTEPHWLALEWANQAGPRGDYRNRAYWSRLYHQLDSLAANGRNNPDCPDFVIGGLEFGKLIPNWRKAWADEGNRYFTEYWVKRAKTGDRVVFVTGNAIAAYLRRHFDKSPRHLIYNHDYLAGTSQRRGPLEIADNIDIEQREFRAILARPEVLPVLHYDFQKQWDYPDFGNEDVIRPWWVRSKAGPLMRWKYDLTPTPEDWRSPTVSRTDEAGKKHRITVTVESPRQARNVPLAIWDIPREWKPGKDWFSTENAREFIPVIAPQTDNLNGVLVVDLKKGANTFAVEISTPERELQTMDTTFVDCVRAKTWTRDTHDGRPVTYLWPQNPWGAKVEVTVPEGRTVTAYLTPNAEERELASGTHTFDLRFNNWLRLTGLTRQEVASAVGLLE